MRVSDSGVSPTAPNAGPVHSARLVHHTQPFGDSLDLEEKNDFGSYEGSGSAPQAPQPKSVQERLRTLVEWFFLAVCALVLALLIRVFLVQAYYIPSRSMQHTLQEDDRVLVNKLSYRFGDIQRGDVIVFAKPDNTPGETKDFIKRVIALPGETIAFSDGQVLIDGNPYYEPYVDRSITSTSGQLMQCANEPHAVDYCLVPEGTVFVMGDNRESSTDSRTFGPIEIDSIVGRAFIKLWPLGDIGLL